MKMIKKIVAILTVGAALFAVGSCDYTSTREAINSEEKLTGLHHVEIEIKDHGTIACELDADKAPASVTNFIDLAKSGFYNGNSFHRIMDGFMMQGGQPKTDEQAKQCKNVYGEFSNNGFTKNDISHVRGTISMARADDMNSGSSQFFIVHKDSLFLDGNYAGFGHVTSGIEIVDDICENTPEEDDNGTVLPENQPIITEIRVID